MIPEEWYKVKRSDLPNNETQAALDRMLVDNEGTINEIRMSDCFGPQYDSCDACRTAASIAGILGKCPSCLSKIQFDTKDETPPWRRRRLIPIECPTCGYLIVACGSRHDRLPTPVGIVTIKSVRPLDDII